MLAANERQTPLRRNVTIEEVGNAGAFLCRTWPAVSAARSSTSMAASTLPPWARWTTTDPAMKNGRFERPFIGRNRKAA